MSTGGDVNISFARSKLSWHFWSHIKGTFFLISLFMCRTTSEYIGIKFAMCPIIPNADFASFTFDGGLILNTVLILSGMTLMPSCDTRCPKYSISFFQNWHLLSLSFKSAFLNFSKIVSKCYKCSSSDSLNTNKSSM